ncbi:hypothetical protein [Burkholderia gladioli]|uniref:hypothetical protein n=1 Tax=Burkholderia gladioli TaxID=28095 RepID=UPI001640A236|nr:hypothetical protein [Burkholderia gladioli]
MVKSFDAGCAMAGDFQFSPEEREFRKDSIIESAYRKCEGLINSLGDIRLVQTPFFEPSFVFVIINLNELLQRASSEKRRVSFTDFVDTADGVDDVTTLINRIRHAVCHIHSPQNNLGKAYFRFNSVAGKRKFGRIGDVLIEGEFEDDVAFFYGDKRVYLRRHIIRALKEVGDIYGLT